MNIITEKILLERIKNKDRKAAEVIINKHYKQVYYFLFKLCREKEIAQDLTQETFIKIWNKIESFDGRSRFSTWIYRISYNVFVDYKRLKKLNTVTINNSDSEILQEDINVMEENVSARIQYGTIRKHIEDLSEKYKEVILLHYEKDLSFNEIGTLLEIPKGTVKSRINSALVELRNQLKIKKS